MTTPVFQREGVKTAMDHRQQMTDPILRPLRNSRLAKHLARRLRRQRLAGQSLVVE